MFHPNAGDGASHLAVQSQSENAPGDALGGSRLKEHEARICAPRSLLQLREPGTLPAVPDRSRSNTLADCFPMAPASPFWVLLLDQAGAGRRSGGLRESGCCARLTVAATEAHRDNDADADADEEDDDSGGARPPNLGRGDRGCDEHPCDRRPGQCSLDACLRECLGESHRPDGIPGYKRQRVALAVIVIKLVALETAGNRSQQHSRRHVAGFRIRGKRAAGRATAETAPFAQSESVPASGGTSRW